MDEELGTSTVSIKKTSGTLATKDSPHKILVASSDHIALVGTPIAPIVPTEQQSKSEKTEVGSNATIRALYPQFYDGNNSQARAISLTLAAADHIESAVESFSTNDVGGIWSALSLAASCLDETHRYTDFNEAFGSLATYCQQALIHPDYNTIDLDALLSMKKVLVALAHQPFIRLSSSVIQIEELERFGWNGNDTNVEKFTEQLLLYFDYPGIDVGTVKSDSEFI
ncbi:MAG: hypothetical protein O9312_03420 [Hylemonella sp.]|nr:hypothetical protein [Hylemonella sp.]